MSRSNLSSALPAGIRRRLDLTAALARKRLHEVHARQAIELVDHVESDMDPGRALDIYVRLHKLTPPEAVALRQEVFVALGRRILPRAIEPEGASAGIRWEDPESTLRLIRRRLRGRVNQELRDWVEHHTGRTETEIFWTHVDNANDFVRLLEKQRSTSDAVALYTGEIDLSPSWSELIYFMLLDQRSPGRSSAPSGIPTPQPVVPAPRITPHTRTTPGPMRRIPNR